MHYTTIANGIGMCCDDKIIFLLSSFFSQGEVVRQDRQTYTDKCGIEFRGEKRRERSLGREENMIK